MNRIILLLAAVTSLFFITSTHASWRNSKADAYVVGKSKYHLQVGCQNFVVISLSGKTNLDVFSFEKGLMTFQIGNKTWKINASAHRKGVQIGTGGRGDNDARVYSLLKGLVKKGESVKVTFRLSSSSKQKLFISDTYSLQNAGSEIKKTIRRCPHVNKHLNF